MKQIQKIAIAAVVLFIGCYPPHSYYRIVSNNNKNHVVFKENEQFYGNLSMAGFQSIIVSSNYICSRNRIDFNIECYNEADSQKCLRLGDLHLVSSLKIDSLDWYIVSDNPKIIRHNKKNQNASICIEAHTKKNITIGFRSIEKIRYDTFKKSFLTDTLTFCYQGRLLETKLVNGNFKEPPLVQRLGWR